MGNTIRIQPERSPSPTMGLRMPEGHEEYHAIFTIIGKTILS